MQDCIYPRFSVSTPCANIAVTSLAASTLFYFRVSTLSARAAPTPIFKGIYNTTGVGVGSSVLYLPRF